MGMNLSAKLRVRGHSNMKPGDSLLMRAYQKSTMEVWTWTLDDLRIYNQLNRRSHWAKRAKECAEAKSRAFNILVRQQVPALPVRVEMVRTGPHLMDSDGLAASLKPIRDGIAEAYGIDDRDGPIQWVPLQERSSKWGVKFTIMRLHPAPGVIVSDAGTQQGAKP